MNFCFFTLISMLITTHNIEGETTSMHCFANKVECVQARSSLLSTWEKFKPFLAVLRADECEDQRDLRAYFRG